MIDAVNYSVPGSALQDLVQSVAVNSVASVSRTYVNTAQIDVTGTSEAMGRSGIFDTRAQRADMSVRN